VALLGCCTPEPETYAQSCAAPPRGWGGPTDGIYELRSWNKASLAGDGTLRWNSVALSDAKFATYLDLAGKLDSEPQILFEIDAKTACARVREVRAIMARAPICREGLCSEGAAGSRWSR